MSRLGLLVGAAAVAIAAFLALRYSQNSTTSLEQPKQALKMPEISKLNLQNWHEFTAPGNQFKVLFPTLPQQANEQLKDPKTKGSRQYEMFVSEKDNGTIFMINIITLLEKPPADSDEKILSGIMNEMVSSSPQSKLKNMKMGRYRNFPALDFSIENQELTIDGKVFVEGNTLYLLSSIAKAATYQPEEFEFFVNSFQLLPKTDSLAAPAKKN